MQGKDVLVDFWATWCMPCTEQFPHTVAITNNCDTAKVAVVSASMNEPDEKEAVEAFLESKGAEFEQLRCGPGGS